MRLHTKNKSAQWCMLVSDCVAMNIGLKVRPSIYILHNRCAAVMPTAVSVPEATTKNT